MSPHLRLNFIILFALIASLDFFTQVADAKRHSRSAARSCRKRSPQSGYVSSGGNTWTKKSRATGNAIIDFFNFETLNQGSQGGSARYVDLQEGYKSDMIGVANDVLYFGVDTTPYAENRKSFRLSSKQTFTPGTLLVVDVLHMPATCGSWPALWTVAQDGAWPEKGEVDIIEGVNMFTQNAMSVHTKSGFWMKAEGFASKFMLSGDQQANCDAYATDDQGCGLRDTDNSTFGVPFNAGKGGVYAMEWTNEAINIFYFPRGSVPADISSGSPSKSPSWGQPRARFQGSGGQSTADYFQDQVLVINTNLCGKWPEGAWSSDSSYAGQAQTCAAITGHATCQDFVTNAGEKLKEAYWAIRSIEVYSW